MQNGPSVLVNGYNGKKFAMRRYSISPADTSNILNVMHIHKLDKKIQYKT